MAMFGLKKNKPSEGSDLVLAYLEEAQRLRVPFLAVDGKSREVPAGLVSVSEEKVTLSSQGSLIAEKGGPLKLLFVLDGLRLAASAKVLDIKPGSATLELPETLSLAERRRKPRARINPREGATAIALTGLFDGVGLNGTVENISEGGLCLRVNRAMGVKTQKKMHMGANILALGQPLVLIKLGKLPKCPPLELSGTVAWVDASQGLLMGIAFERGKEALLAPVRNLVSSRAGSIPSALPPKARRQPEADQEAEEEVPVPRPAPKKMPEPTPKEDLQPRTAVVFAPEPPSTVPVVPSPVPTEARSQALLRVEKRGRNLLLAMPEGPERQALADFLQKDGYGSVACARTLSGLLEAVEGPDLHLILVDGGVAELRGLSLASLLRHQLGDAMPPVILAEDSVDAELVLGAQATGLAQILVKPYALDAEFLHLIEGHLGIG